jgi:hypothetical protein
VISMLMSSSQLLNGLANTVHARSVEHHLAFASH